MQGFFGHFSDLTPTSTMFESFQSTVVLPALALWCIHSLVSLAGTTKKVREVPRPPLLVMNRVFADVPLFLIALTYPKHWI